MPGTLRRPLLSSDREKHFIFTNIYIKERDRDRGQYRDVWRRGTLNTNFYYIVVIRIGAGRKGRSEKFGGKSEKGRIKENLPVMGLKGHFMERWTARANISDCERRSKRVGS